jgi:hypothetical protein
MLSLWRTHLSATTGGSSTLELLLMVEHFKTVEKTPLPITLRECNVTGEHAMNKWLLASTEY